MEAFAAAFLPKILTILTISSNSCRQRQLPKCRPATYFSFLDAFLAFSQSVSQSGGGDQDQLDLSLYLIVLSIYLFDT